MVPLKPAGEQLGKDNEFEDSRNSSEKDDERTERQIDATPIDCANSPWHTWCGAGKFLFPRHSAFSLGYKQQNS